MWFKFIANAISYYTLPVFWYMDIMIIIFYLSILHEPHLNKLNHMRGWTRKLSGFTIVLPSSLYYKLMRKFEILHFVHDGLLH